QPLVKSAGAHLEPGDPRALIVGIHLGLEREPAFAAIRAREVETRGADVSHDLTDAPLAFTARGGPSPGGRGSWQRRHVALGAPSHAIEEAEIGRDVGDHVDASCCKCAGVIMPEADPAGKARSVTG